MRILGLGTGRCGTASLARLLAQQGLDCVHEREPTLSWENEPDASRHISQPGSCDVALQYLPHVECLMGQFDDLRCVCLKRDREKTIASFARIRPLCSHWFSTKPDQTNVNDRSFPKYDLPFEESVGRYWDDYYAKAESLECERFRVYPTETLNDPSGVRELLTFLGIPEPVVVVGIHIN